MVTKDTGAAYQSLYGCGCDAKYYEDENDKASSSDRCLSEEGV